jgi:integrase
VITDKLSALRVSRETRPGLYGDGGGLWLQVSGTGTKSWIFRYTSPITRKTRDMGLGALSAVSLAQARLKAKQARELVASGGDPIAQRDAALLAARAAFERSITFDACAKMYIDAHQAGWKNAKHAAQWTSSLARYASPKIGAMALGSIDLPAILGVLEPIWKDKSETASRVRGRIESILDWATVRGYRKGDNPARWKGHLDTLLPAPSKIAKVEHHPALPYGQVARFIRDLEARKGFAARALHFCILTAARSGEVRHMTWDEIHGDVWIVPEKRMKAGKEHRVPLSLQAKKVLSETPRLVDVDIVFPALSNAAMSDAAMSALLGRMGYFDITVHGFRSTFRDWAAETTNFPREVIEHALAHQLKDKAEAAYQRGDLLARRAKLMQAWGDFCHAAAPSLTD